MLQKKAQDKVTLSPIQSLFERLSLSPEARLLDTGGFILKAALAMLAAFWLGPMMPLANRDMISFLFAMMLSLEPVSTTGFKRGKDQFVATLIGGLVSGVIVAVVGINPMGLALSIAAILYLTLHRNWREISVVALFTGIYMTQFLQTDVNGLVDIPLTMLVRIVALTSGIAFAMVFNVLTSLLLMGGIPKKRLCFLTYRLSKHLERFILKLESGSPIVDSDHLTMSNLFNDIDWTISLLSDLRADKLLKLGRLTPETVDEAIKKAKGLRTFCHYLFDLEIGVRQHPDLLNPEGNLAIIQILNTYVHGFENCREGKIEVETARMHHLPLRFRENIANMTEAIN